MHGVAYFQSQRFLFRLSLEKPINQINEWAVNMGSDIHKLLHNPKTHLNTQPDCEFAVALPNVNHFALHTKVKIRKIIEQTINHST